MRTQTSPQVPLPDGCLTLPDGLPDGSNFCKSLQSRKVDGLTAQTPPGSPIPNLPAQLPAPKFLNVGGPTLRSLSSEVLSCPRKQMMPPALLMSESEEVAVGPHVHQIFSEGWCGSNFLADDISSQDFQLFRACIDDDNRARV